MFLFNVISINYCLTLTQSWMLLHTNTAKMQSSVQGCVSWGFCFFPIRWSNLTKLQLWDTNRHFQAKTKKLRIKVQPTAFWPLTLIYEVWLWPLTLMFNPRRAMVITHKHAKGQDQRSLSSKVKVEMDRWTQAIALPPMLKQSVTSEI